MDEECIGTCAKSATLTNLNKVSFFIDKSKGEYNRIYNERNFLNTAIVNDLPDVFSSFFIDLRDVKTDTTIKMEKSKLIKHFENYLGGNSEAELRLEEIIHPTTNTQYKKGL